MTQPEIASSRAVESLQTSLNRARCSRPLVLDQMVSSLSRHGQLTPVVAVIRAESWEVVDGFKRVEGARRLKWPTLKVSVARVDEMGQWAAMLLLNGGSTSMTELEEALVIRELVRKGLTHAAVSELVGRHKSWVSRRVGLVDRLHPELVEQMRVGLLHPGVARRLLALPPGNQLQVAASAQQARLKPRDTELLVSLWQRAPTPELKKQLLAQPLQSVRKAFPEHSRPPLDARLSQAGQHLARTLHQVSALSSRALRLLPPSPTDLALLAPMLTQAEQTACLLASALGSSGSDGGRSVSGAAGATSSSSP